VRELHVWTDRPSGWCRKVWIVPRTGRPFLTPSIGICGSGPLPGVPTIQPTCHLNGAGFWDFGTGAIGDMGVHNLDTAFLALELGFADLGDSDRFARGTTNSPPSGA